MYIFYADVLVPKLVRATEAAQTTEAPETMARERGSPEPRYLVRILESKMELQMQNIIAPAVLPALSAIS
jgi:hypothetical protein